jgi:hypothetical protein
MVWFKFNLKCIFSKKSLLFVFLLLLVVIIFFPLVSEVNGWVGYNVAVKNEAELRNAISAAPDEGYSIWISGVIVLQKSLEIPEGKVINLGGGRLVGGRGVDTIVVKSGGVLYLSGRILVTHVVGASGRGVYVESGGIFTLQDGVISGNSAVNGGGVYNEGTFTMYGVDMEDHEVCIISDNKADYGGGVYNKGTFIAYGGEIFNNTAVKSGGGVYGAGVFDRRTDYRSDSVSVYSNVATSGKGDNVFIESTCSGPLYLLLIVMVAVVVISGLFVYRSKRRNRSVKNGLVGLVAVV